MDVCLLKAAGFRKTRRKKERKKRNSSVTNRLLLELYILLLSGKKTMRSAGLTVALNRESGSGML